MHTVTAEHAKAHLEELIAQTAADHQPIQITGEQASAVILAQKDWNAIAETLYLSAIPGMTDSLREGMQATAAELSDKVDW
ncbi:type II toxin-antitoxin system Phd/YefM family antitoxin [uncultured Thiohalocapsa sp.]|uniref:type II toxin-antitoxin system Phd/YefM family antitoxin n=1 Tax=uncultured Thiohalocapsa sp. TaxID=768990 RepID=UPI0025DC287F|nr:type II toxin-antitoxin system Phd/YefM family antitoxin [uncultured Thiohalocapsa sp.]